MHGSRMSRDPRNSLDQHEARTEQVAPAQAVGQSERAHEVLTPAAERLAGKYPAAASLLYCRMVKSIPEPGSSRGYGYAARDVLDAGGLAGRVADEGGIESHDAFVVRLKREHGRKYGFCSCSGRNDARRNAMRLIL